MRWIKYAIYSACAVWCVLGVALFIEIEPYCYKYYEYVREDVSAEVRSYIDKFIVEKYGHSIDLDLQEYAKNKKIFSDYVQEKRVELLISYRSEVFFKRFGHVFNSSSQLDIIGWNEIDDVLWEEFYPEEDSSASPYGFDEVFYEYMYFKYKDLNRGDVVSFASNIRKKIVNDKYGDIIRNEFHRERLERGLWTVFPPAILLAVMWCLRTLFRRLRVKLGN